MASSIQDIINGAMNKSAKNRPDLIATSSTELVAAVDRTISVLYQLASVVNPIVFSNDDIVVATPSVGWLRPASAAAVLRITKMDGTEVGIVPLDDQTGEPGMPCVYEFGNYYRLASGTTGLSLADNLVIYYARSYYNHLGPAFIIGADWPEMFNGLLIADLALYLAMKDGRMDEVAVLRAERDQWFKQFLTFLQNYTVGERRRWTRFSPDLATHQFTAMLAGGA